MSMKNALHQTQTPSLFEAGSQKITLVYVLGAGHCGSTLLSLALDRHSDMISVSEIVGLNAKKAGWAGNEDFRQHEFWSSVAANHLQDFNADFWAVPFASPARKSKLPDVQWGKENAQALSSIAKAAGVSCVVDASKQPRRLEVLLQEKVADVRVVYLVRDARAIVHSYDRKYSSLWRGYRQVKRLDRRARSIKRRFPDVPWLTLRYEDMTGDFGGSMKKVCKFCELNFEQEILKPESSSFVGVGGNRLRKKPVKEVSADRSWESEMPVWKQMILSFGFILYSLRLGFPLLKCRKRSV